MKHKGFTLVELIISLNITLILVGGMLFAFGQASRSWKRVARRAERLQIENIITERICRDARGADEIMTGSGSSEIKLKLGSATVSYSLSAGKVRRKMGGSTAYLTNDNEIERLNFAYPVKNFAEVHLDNYVFLVAVRN